MHFDYDTVDRIGTRATLGVVVLQTDETLEHDLRRLLPNDGVALLATRIPSGAAVTSNTLMQMKADLPQAASLFPRGMAFDTVGYGCTSGTSVIGAPAIAGLIKGSCDTSHVTEPISALIAACRALRVQRLGFLSPYVAEVNDRLRGVLADNGVESPVFGSFDESEDAKVARIAPASLAQAATALAEQGGVDAIFMSCTNLRTLDVITDIEAATGLPVLSSNLVLAWHMASLSGLRLAHGFGRLSRL